MSKYKILLGFLLVSLGINVVAIFLFANSRDEIIAQNDFEAKVEKYPYLSKRILHEFPQDILINFLALRRELRTEVSRYGDNQFGVYFEYLPTGTSIGINDRTDFHAASLFKVPLVMAFYHAKERGFVNGDPVVQLKKENLDKDFGNLWKKGEGYEIKASDLVKITLQDSDNTAAKSLATLIEEQDFNAVYTGLDIDLQSDDEGALISAKNYSSILKALYFSSVLDNESSHEILDLLTRTNFPDKISAGIPAEIPVAHKIGDFIDDKGNEGYRDCGIVYAPRRPYLICMFSVGNEQIARERMQRVSKMIYDYVSKTD